MAEGKREYTAMFTIGAKLLGSFKGAMMQAKARLTELAKTARTVGAVMKGIGIAAAGAAAAIAGTILGVVGSQLWGMFKKIWEGALDNAEATEDRHRTLLAYLKTDNQFRKQGNVFMENQIALLDKHNEKLAEQTGMSQDNYDQANKTLITYGAMPHHLAEMSGPMGDLLAVTKGPRANMQDMASLAHQIGYAIQGGPSRQLMRLNLLTQEDIKNWQKMSKQQRYEKLLKGMKKFEGEAKKAMDTPVGRIVKLDTAMQKLSSTLGETLLPVAADMADMWRAIVETPAFRGAMLAAAKGFAAVQKGIADFTLNKLIPAFNQLSENPVWDQMMKSAGAFFTFLGDQILLFGEDFAKMWESTLRELQVVLAGLATISEKAMPAYKSVSKMVAELDAKKAMLKAPVGTPPAYLAGHPPAAPYEPPSAVPGKYTAVWPKEIAQLKQANEEAQNFTKNKPVYAPDKTAFERWQAFGDELLRINETQKSTGAVIEATVKKGPFKALEDGVQATINLGNAIRESILGPLQQSKAAADSLNASLGAAGSLPNPAPKELDTANMPHYAEGGMVTQPTVAMIGEKGPELILPLSKINTMTKSWDEMSDTLNTLTTTWQDFAEVVMNGARFMGKAIKTSFGGGGGGGGGGGAYGPAGVAPAGFAKESAPLPPAALKQIQDERAGIIADMMRPEMRNLVSATLSTEAGTAEGQKNVLEAMVNRAVAQKQTSVEKMIKGGFYGPYNRGETAGVMSKGLSDARSQQVGDIISEIGAGRNALRGMTDQGMVNEIKGYKENIAGEYYGFMQGMGEQYKTAAYTLAGAGSTPAAYGDGGIVTKPTIAQVGEKGPEAVIPLSGHFANTRRLLGATIDAVKGMSFGRPTKDEVASMTMPYEKGAFGGPTGLGTGGILKGIASMMAAPNPPAAGPTHVNFTPSITINGNATPEDQAAMTTKLRDLAKDFIEQFKQAQYQERRLSYDSGYG